MKLIALLSAGALAAGTMAAMPADAQRYHDGYGYHHGYDGYRHGYDRGGYGRGYYGHGYRHGYYGPGYGYRHHRVICRIHRGYYGPVRRCFPAYR